VSPGPAAGIPLYLSKPGLVCCAGADYRTFFEAALRGDQGGIVPVTVNPVNGGSGGPARTFLVGRAETGAPAETRLWGLCRAALEQVQPAVERAFSAWGPDRVGLCLGSCDNGTEFSLPAHGTFFAAGAFPPGYELSLQGAAGPAEYAARFLGLGGPVLALATACASSATALIRGAELIRGGVCDAVVAGGVDIASPTVLFGFAALETVSPERCNPFSKNRRGINLGEGAAFFVLSREKPEGPVITLAGYGESADAHHMTSPHPAGTGAAGAMEKALAMAALEAGDIGYVNLHGTGTPLNDRAEAAAMAAVFGGARPAVSSTKPLTGHTLGAAGALELALCWGALETGGIPVHRWDGVQDEDLPAQLRWAVPRAEPPGPAALASTAKIRYCMSNSFAFGGCNVSLILGGEEEPET
jgi:3-oxoacyl-[acyl-carrier-protein] synthase-1